MMMQRDSASKTELQSDPYIASNLVVGLTGDTFSQFLIKKDIVMVMFYDADDPRCTWSRKHFKKAAELTTRPGHAYAAVNCNKEADFCMNEDITHFPHFKMYLQGKLVDYFHPNNYTFVYSDYKESISAEPLSDPFVNSDLVVGLNSKLFIPYLQTKDVALVMFYSRHESYSYWLKQHLKLAAETTIRPGHVYAAIDCDKEIDFCVSEGVPDLPFFQIYVKGEKQRDIIPDSQHFLVKDMIKWVEGLPIP